jgi:hypothetical protein
MRSARSVWDASLQCSWLAVSLAAIAHLARVFQVEGTARSVSLEALIGVPAPYCMQARIAIDEINTAAGAKIGSKTWATIILLRRRNLQDHELIHQMRLHARPLLGRRTA